VNWTKDFQCLSPDGKSLAYTYFDPKANPSQRLTIVPFDGGSSTKEFGIASDLIPFPRWAPDDRSILYTKDSDIWSQSIAGGEPKQIIHAEVSPRYFESLHIPILEGREFTPDDDERAPRVLIVDQTAARRYWPGQDPLGKNLRIWGRLFTVVGVARNSTHIFVNESAEPMVYMSFFQQGYETIVQVETEGNPVDLAPAVQNTINQIDTRLPVFDVRSMRESTQMASSFAVIQSTLAGIFALIGLVLAITGIYGVVAYRTQLRTHEIGIRMAQGASRVDVLRLVLLQGLWLTGIGLALGLASALGLTRIIVRLLYGIGANDPVTMASVITLLGTMSLVACYLPAHRAMRRNPVTAIREL
jgi:predicted permease